MKIDKSNYEIWLIDWLDGNLTDFQIERLQHFLRENPELKEEFEELTTFRLNPSGLSFPHKNNLKKTIAELSRSHIEYLSVAYLENDLTAEEERELLESIEYDNEKKLSFELIQRTRLSPGNISYKHKNRLIKRSFSQNVMRWSLIGLSAAAIATVVIITSVSTPHTLNVNINKTAHAVASASTPREQQFGVASNHVRTGSIINPSKNRSKTFIGLLKRPQVNSQLNNNQPAEIDSLSVSYDHSPIIINKIRISPSIGLNGDFSRNTLIAFIPAATVQEYDEGRSKLRRFIAKTFREKILKENKAKDSPLKAYELAKAGVSGLDKLLGWEMALDERKDTNGVLKSVYFSSKILKFNAPVKNTEPLP
jgi:hypothetical protein